MKKNVDSRWSSLSKRRVSRYSLGGGTQGMATITALSAFKLMHAAVAAGVDARRLPQVDIDSATEGLETRIPFDSLIDLWESTMRLVDDPAFPIFAGSQVTSKDFDAIGFAC